MGNDQSKLVETLARMMYQELQKQYMRNDQLDSSLLLGGARDTLSTLEITAVTAANVLVEMQRLRLVKRDVHGIIRMQ